MNPLPNPVKWGIALVILAVLSLTTLHYLQKHHEKVGTTQEKAAVVHDSRASVLAQDAKQVEQQAQAKGKEVEADDQKVSRLRSRLAGLAPRKLVPSQPDGRGDVLVPPGPGDSAAPVDRSTTEDTKDELIEAQAQEISHLKEQVALEHERGDKFEAAYEEERKALLAQQAATDAWKKACREAEWKGGLKGAGLALIVKSLVHH